MHILVLVNWSHLFVSKRNVIFINKVKSYNCFYSKAETGGGGRSRQFQFSENLLNFLKLL